MIYYIYKIECTKNNKVYIDYVVLVHQIVKKYINKV